MNGGGRRARGLFLVALSEFAKTSIMARLPGLGGIERASAATVAVIGCAVFSGQRPGGHRSYQTCSYWIQAAFASIRASSG